MTNKIIMQQNIYKDLKLTGHYQNTKIHENRIEIVSNYARDPMLKRINPFILSSNL
jgi:hypothetical protein